MARDYEVGIVGAGIGGLMASIAIAKAGARVTVLEAASQLGEIGAGIQMVRCSDCLRCARGADLLDAKCRPTAYEIWSGRGHWREPRPLY